MQILFVTQNEELAHRYLQGLKPYRTQGVVCLPEHLTQNWRPRVDAVLFMEDISIYQLKLMRFFFEELLPKTPVLVLNQNLLSSLEKAGWAQALKQSILIGSQLGFQDIKSLLEQILGDQELVDHLQVGPFLLDRRERVLVHKGHAIQLNQKEFFLLELLMLHHGQVITRDRIIDHVWEPRQIVGSNTIEVYVSRLRQKLKCYDRKALINAVPCLGYRFSI